MGMSGAGGREGGFTLLELLISMGLMAIALVSVFSLLAQDLEVQSEARFLTIAHSLLQDRLAQVQARERLSPGRVSGDLEEEAPGYSFMEEIEETEGTAGLWRVRVSVFHQGNRSSREVWAETVLYRPSI